MSWPYEKCAGVRADGERCSSRAGYGSLYCHHHDPARKTSTAPAPTPAPVGSTRAAGRPLPAPSGSALAEPARAALTDELLDEGVDFEDVLRGDLPERAPAARAAAVPAKKPRRRNGTPPVLADVAVTEEEHERVEATVGDILREARSSSREAIEETVALLLDARRTVNVTVPPGAVPGQTISVQVPDLKLRLDGLKFVSERVEGRAVEARSTTSSGNYPMPTTLAEWELLPFKWKFAFIAVRELPGIERLIEDGNPDAWEALRKNDVRVESLRWIVGELDKLERQAALT